MNNQRVNDNYLRIENNDGKPANIFCFSSNAIYYPNTNSQFYKNIYLKDKYEMFNIKDLYSNTIYVRDIFKQWYQEGISNKLDSLKKIFDTLNCLRDSSKDTFMIGSSAGGYMAVLSAIKLNAKYAISLAGQFNLEFVLKNSNKEKDPVIFSTERDYFDLKPLLQNSYTTVFYFVGVHSKIDQQEIEHIETLNNVKIFKFNSAKHGVPFYPFLLKTIVSKNFEELSSLHKNYKNKIISPLKFSIKLIGIRKTLSEIGKFIIKKYLKVSEVGSKC